VDGFLACRRHTQLVQDFLVGLRIYGALAQTLLMAWDHIQSTVEYPFQPEVKKAQPQTQLPSSRASPPRISPDGKGNARVYGASLAQFTDTAFWLEVDRGTEKGQTLLSKLARYYRIQSMNATNDGGQTPKLKRIPQPITAAEALEMLQSAVNYCQSAGLTIRAGNVPNLVLSIDGAMMDGDPPRFRLAEVASEATTPANEIATGSEATPPARPVRSRL
jgi:hypothetical protein